MHNAELILTLTAGLTGALALGFVALRLRLPPIVGYLLAGVLVGPHTPGFVANRAIAEQLAEVGVILLMFGVGLHFHLKDLLAVRKIALTGAVIQIASATALGAIATHALGWTWTAGLVFGVALSVASTVVLTRVLGDNRDLHTQTGRIAIGWLVTEDIFTVFALVLLPELVGAGAADPAVLARAVGLSALKLTALAALTLGPGARIIPRVLGAAARTRSRELFTLAVLVLALGIAVASAELFGVSMALGAFLAGMVVGQSEFSYRAASEALPMRDAFAVLFFVSVGMLFDPQRLVDEPALTAVALAIVLAGKPVAAFVITALLHDARGALRVSVALAQVGEFSFMLAVLGSELGVLPVGATDSIVAAAIVTITLNPLLYRSIPAIQKRLFRGARVPQVEPRREMQDRVGAVVIGYGPVGEAACRLLRERGVAPSVIELNIDTVRRLNSQGVRAVYGDAAQPGVLAEAGAGTAGALVISAPGSPEFSELIRVARAMNPGILILARSAYQPDTGVLRQAGADEVISGEAEVARAMVEAIEARMHLGADGHRFRER